MEIGRKSTHKLLLCGLLGVNERRHGPNLRNLNLAAEYGSPETSRGNAWKDQAIAAKWTAYVRLYVVLVIVRSSLRSIDGN
jgi:hypothetical protein